MKSAPITAVIPTCNRPKILERALASLLEQSLWPKEVVIVDGSTDSSSHKVVSKWEGKITPHCHVIWQAAIELGAATQRNQGVSQATQPYICFFDDDILFEADCLERLWNSLTSDNELGGVSAMISNQSYPSPGWISWSLFTILAGRRQKSFAGQVIGPAINMLPEDREDLPEIVGVEWLNLGCTLYRREALPNPPFDSMFTGYSMMEDLTLSLRVARKWRLANVRTARIFHDSQPGAHKDNVTDLARMELVNRHYVMTAILDRNQFTDYFKLLLWEVFQIFVGLIQCASLSKSMQTILGKAFGLREIWRASRQVTTGAISRLK